MKKPLQTCCGQKVRDYRLDDQVGYKLRLATQRHLEIFSRRIANLTPTQFSVLVRLDEVGEVSQNQLGRLVAMDAATTKGVVKRLIEKGFVSSKRDKEDVRRLQISLTSEGKQEITKCIKDAKKITEETTSTLTKDEITQLLFLLDKLEKKF